MALIKYETVRRAMGICVNHDGKRALPNRRLCEECLIKHRKACRAYKLKHRAELKAISSKWKKSNPLKVSAHQYVYRAISAGTLVRPDKCSRCGKLGRPQAHHPDYKKPLEIIWLCYPCHRVVHGANDADT